MEKLNNLFLINPLLNNTSFSRLFFINHFVCGMFSSTTTFAPAILHHRVCIRTAVKLQNIMLLNADYDYVDDADDVQG